MPRYFFNLYNDVTALDSEGVELDDLAAAKVQARTGAAQIIAERITAGDRLKPDHRIEVEDETRRVVFILRFRELVAWEDRNDD